MNLNQKIAVIITDILLLAEVCISMYFAYRSAPEMLTIVFIKTFFMMCIPTLKDLALLLHPLARKLSAGDHIYFGWRFSFTSLHS